MQLQKGKRRFRGTGGVNYRTKLSKIRAVEVMEDACSDGFAGNGQ